MKRKRHQEKWERNYSNPNTIKYFMQHYFKKENLHNCVSHIEMIDEYRGKIYFTSYAQFDLRGWKKDKSDF